MTKKLTRNPYDKMVAGVSSGLAKYFDLDVTWVRIAFALAAFFGGSGIWIYIILWIAVPEDKASPFNYTDYRVDPDGETTETYGSTFEPKNEKMNINLIGGLILIVLGSYFLLDEFHVIPLWFRLGRLWPLVVVGIGLSILFKGVKQETGPKDFDPSDFKKKPEDQENAQDEPKQQEQKTNSHEK